MAFELPRADRPEDVGLSSARLQRLRNVLSRCDGNKVVIAVNHQRRYLQTLQLRKQVPAR